MDQQKLRTLVFEKTGVKIDVDDPIFALVALNEAVLAEAVERHVALLDDATADLADQLELLQENGAGCRYNGAGAPERPALVKPAAAATAAAAGTPDQRQLMLAGGAALLCAVLVLGGQALLFKPPAPAVPVQVAKELSAEQSAALRDADKLNKIIQKLDPKTRSAIQAELQKP